MEESGQTYFEDPANIPPEDLKRYKDAVDAEVEAKLAFRAAFDEKLAEQMEKLARG